MGLRKSTTFLDPDNPSLPTWYTDLTLRDQRELMERPFFSLSKRPRTESIIYDMGDVYVRVDPGKDWGLATIWDADILIWAATEIVGLLNANKPFSRELHFHPNALLRSIGRGSGKRQYQLLEEALERLHRTSVTTSVRANNRKRRAQFHWIDSWDKLTKEETGKSIGWTLTLSNWMYRGIIQKGGVLAIHKDYFFLTGGLERWLYRVARKHGGSQPDGWPLTMTQLYQKSGSQDRPSNFRIKIRDIVKQNILPEYTLSIFTPVGGEETVLIRPRKPALEQTPEPDLFELP